MGGLIEILLSISSGFGLAFLLGVTYTSANAVVAFLVLGIGVVCYFIYIIKQKDDMFVIIDLFHQQDPSDPIEIRVPKAMAFGSHSNA